jgi:hypoxanthine phosphoribosyltransferase
MVGWLNKVTLDIEQFKPDEVVAVARSGFSYAMWIAQMLKLPLGAYWPDKAQLVLGNDKSRRVVIVDDNTMAGRTYLDVKQFMQNTYPNIEFKFAVLFSDYQTPQYILDEILTGEIVDYYITAPFPGMMKDCQPGVRYRDQQ